VGIHLQYSFHFLLVADFIYGYKFCWHPYW